MWKNTDQLNSNVQGVLFLSTEEESVTQSPALSVLGPHINRHQNAHALSVSHFA